MSAESRDKLLDELSIQFDTRDKAWMFIRIEFRSLISKIDLEGSPDQRAFNIYDEFEKQGMIGSLMAMMNARLGTDLYMVLKAPTS